MQILRTSDRIKVKIADVGLVMSPMRQAKKLEMSKMTKVKNGKEVVDLDQMLSFVVKHCVKDIDGVNGADGEPIKLTFDQDGCLDEDSHSDVMAVVTGLKLHYDALLAVAGSKMPKSEVMDYSTGEVVEGAEITILPKPQVTSESQK
jgi:D-lyxose ketol-isomerase